MKNFTLFLTLILSIFFNGFSQINYIGQTKDQIAINACFTISPESGEYHEKENVQVAFGDSIVIHDFEKNKITTCYFEESSSGTETCILFREVYYNTTRNYITQLLTVKYGYCGDNIWNIFIEDNFCQFNLLERNSEHLFILEVCTYLAFK